MPNKFIQRCEPNSNSGFVKWPLHLRAGDPGCFVVAVFLDDRPFPGGEDPFVRCLEVGNVHISDVESLPLGIERERLWPWDGMARADVPEAAHGNEHVSQGLLAAVTLGTCGAAFMLPGGDTWRATRADLTDDGVALIGMLERFYNREAVFVTCVDT
jgi:hypothetical protein